MPTFSPEPSDAEITRARLFAEPLVPIGERANGENAALARALEAYLKAGAGESVSPLVAFLRQYPGSAWRISLLTDLGLVYRRTGYFLRALDAWEKAWRLSKDATDPIGAAVADAAVGELAELNARLGRYDRLESLFAEIAGRDIRGSATEKIAGAKQGLWLMRNKPEDAFRCGPMAIDRILAYGRADYRRDSRLTDSQSTLRGMSLVQVRDLAKQVGLDVQMAKRDPGAEFLYPAVVHWKAGHYAALIKRDGDRYLVQDPTFGDDMWLSRAALEEESSGFALVPAGQLPSGWRPATEAEGNGIWGKGNTNGGNPQLFGPNNHRTAPSCSNPKCSCMAGYAVHTVLVSLNLVDTPVEYSPPVGPAIDFTVRYNQRDVFQPQLFYYSNFGPKWTTDWISYLEDDPSTPSANVNLYGRGGGQETYSGFNSTTQSYAPHYQSHAVVVRTSSSPIRYERQLPDGSKEVFSQPDGSLAFPRKVLMTDWVDAQGNGVHLTWDSSLRIVAFTDALGQVTTLSYDLSSDPLKVTKVTDPFGRFATFEYNSDGRLQRITDVIGLASEFTYTTQDRIDSLTTPYGTTTFGFGEAGRDRWIEVTDPLGGRERLEYRNQTTIPTSDPTPAGFTPAQNLENRNTFYWDKKAMAVAPGDYAKAHIYHWLHGGPDFNLTSEPLESEKEALENRVWYLYPNQPNYSGVGSSALPTRVARILDDGVTQTYSYEYGPRGNVIKAVDPSGRETKYTYGTGSTPDPDPTTGTGIDLLKIEQKNGAGYDLLEWTTYNPQHRPLTVTDASGQTTTYTYNAQGQVLP